MWSSVTACIRIFFPSFILILPTSPWKAKQFPGRLLGCKSASGSDSKSTFKNLKNVIVLLAGYGSVLGIEIMEP